MIEKEINLDFDRLNRLGMVEAVWGENKTCDQIAEILKKFQVSSQLALVTRVSDEKASKLLNDFKNVQYHSDAACLTLGAAHPMDLSLGKVLVLGAGTSDLSVASEALLSLQLHGIETDLLLDVGVAGLHRLLSNLDRLKEARVIIVCAGMEGSLATVVSGLTPQPVIGLPVSVGYGISRNGKAALKSMLASCAPGLLTVNIDNGYGAAMAALRILKSGITSD